MSNVVGPSRIFHWAGRHRQKASQRSNHWEMGHFIRGEAMLQQMKLVHLNITGHSASSTYADQASKGCNVLEKYLRAGKNEEDLPDMDWTG